MMVGCDQPNDPQHFDELPQETFAALLYNLDYLARRCCVPILASHWGDERNASRLLTLVSLLSLSLQRVL